MISEFILTDPPFISCHAPSISLTENGLVAAWFAGDSEGYEKSGIWVSIKRGDQWSEPTQVFNGKQPSGSLFACWNPVLYQREDGILLLFYKVGKSPSEWWGMLATSENQGQSWSTPGRLPSFAFGPTKNKPVPLGDGRLLCPGSDEKDGYWKLQFEIMSERTWELAGIPNSPDFGCIQPTVLRYSKTELQALCRSENGVIVETWSYNDGRSWSKLVSTGLPNPNSGIDAISVNKNKHILIYNNSKSDRSSLVAAISKNGKIWKNFLTLESGQGEYSYPSIIKDSNDSLHIVYTWNRKNIKYLLLSLDDIA